MGPKEAACFRLCQNGSYKEAGRKKRDAVKEEEGKRFGAPSKRCKIACIFINSCKKTPRAFSVKETDARLDIEEVHYH